MSKGNPILYHQDCLSCGICLHLCSCRCGKLYERTRLTIDTRLHACSQCHSRLTYLGKFTKAGQLAGKREGGTNSAYNMFVKDQFQQVKRSMPPGTPIAEVMRQIGSSWKEKKVADVKQQQDLQQEEQWQQEGQHRAGVMQMVVAAAATSQGSHGVGGTQGMHEASRQAAAAKTEAASSGSKGSFAETHEEQGGVSQVLSFLERLDLTTDE